MHNSYFGLLLFIDHEWRQTVLPEIHKPSPNDGGGGLSQLVNAWIPMFILLE